jgi:uncharacterized protein YkwD
MIYYFLFFLLVEEHNKVRESYNLRTFIVDDQLMHWADLHARKMAKEERMFHSDKNVHENVAIGKMSVKDVVQMWMNSPGHRKNILNPSLTKIGAAAYQKNGQYYWCVMLL